MMLLLCALAGGLLGSIPTAYLIVKHRRGFDLHRVGSENVGANNALATTGSKGIGAAVLVLDLLKGVLAVLAGWGIASALGAASSFWPGASALLGAIAAHNVNPWLSLASGRVAGGKGIATAAGGFGLLLPWAVLAWCVLFALGLLGFAQWRGIKDSIPGNVLATAGVPLVGWALYGGAAALALLGFALLVLPKHVAQMRALLAAPYGVKPDADRLVRAEGPGSGA